MEPVLDFRNANTLAASVLFETWRRLGLQHVVVSPGSRSTPLAFAAAVHPALAALPVLDERSAGFLALGLARRTRRPVALVCTSGTAVANYLPAVIEASEAEVPLLVLTADRPPELRDCRSGQAIDQARLFEGHVRWQAETAPAEPELGALAALRQTAVHAWDRATAGVSGPVHLNLPLRDPLPPLADGRADRLEATFPRQRFFAGLAPAPGGAVPALPPPPSGPGLIVAGAAWPAAPRRYAQAVGALARRLGWPVLADALNPARHFAAEVPHLVTAYDAILRQPAAADTLAAGTVLVLDDVPTSKVLRQWLQRTDPELWFASASDRNRNPWHGRGRHLRTGVEAVAAAWQGDGAAPSDLTGRWKEAEVRVAARITAALADSGGFEGRIARVLAEHLPPGTPVLVANSMPVRDAEFFWSATDRGYDFHCNRGANGIDGTLSTALGLAHGGGPAVLLTGDLAFLHDANGLLFAPHLRGHLTIVLVNNDGGGIFEMLPVSRFDPPFERMTAMPQRVDFARLAAAHGVDHELLSDVGELAQRVEELPPSGMRILELRTDRKRDAATRRALLDAAGA